jgi:predicted phage terminase large subunit-like protein
LSELSLDERQTIALRLLDDPDTSDEFAHLISKDWKNIWARPNQLPPEGDWLTWLILAGRGWGKTKTGAECVIDWAQEPRIRIALVAKDAADARDVMVEGESGIMESSPVNFRPIYEPSKKRLTWPNGTRAFIFSAEDPDSLRGPQFHKAWGDEICKWVYGQETWDNLQFGLRLGDNPQQVMTTTPRPIKLLKDLIQRDDTIITKGSTYENLNNLAAPFRKSVISRYEGTRLGRQELSAELLDDIPGSLWGRAQVDKMRAARHENQAMVTYEGKQIDLAEIVVALDPPTSSGDEANEAGIIAAAKGRDGRGYVLADRSLQGSPDEWGRTAIRVFDELRANWLIYEANQGGEMVAHVLMSCAKAMRLEGLRDTDHIPLKAVHASRGKVTRAEPVSALYEQGRVSHVGFLPLLEDQMCEFTSDFDRTKAGYSPDRVDALVWALTGLLVNWVENEGLLEFYRLENERIGNKLANAIVDEERRVVVLKPPVGVNTAHGLSGAKYGLSDDGLMRVTAEDAIPLTRAGFIRCEEGS